MEKGVKCPKCNSTNIHPVEQYKKPFSWGRISVPGTVRSPVIYYLLWLLESKGKQDIFCSDCGHSWKAKL